MSRHEKNEAAEMHKRSTMAQSSDLRVMGALKRLIMG